MKIIVSPSPREDVNRNEKTGDCFKCEDHYYSVEDNFVLHVKHLETINSLYDNFITTSKNDLSFIKITQEEFNIALNETIFELNLFNKKYKNK